jgi:hypothetical protein
MAKNRLFAKIGISHDICHGKCKFAKKSNFGQILTNFDFFSKIGGGHFLLRHEKEKGLSPCIGKQKKHTFGS